MIWALPSYPRLRARVADIADADTPVFWSMLCRVETERGSHIVPELVDGWSDLDKLRWLAAVARVDAGVDVEVKLGRIWINGKRHRGWYSVRFGPSALVYLGSFESSWSRITAQLGRTTP